LVEVAVVSISAGPFGFGCLLIYSLFGPYGGALTGASVGGALMALIVVWLDELIEVEEMEEL